MRIYDDDLSMDDYVKYSDSFPHDVTNLAYFNDGKISYWNTFRQLGLLNMDGSIFMKPIYIDKMLKIGDLTIWDDGSFGKMGKLEVPQYTLSDVSKKEGGDDSNKIGELGIKKHFGNDSEIVCILPESAKIKVPVGTFSSTGEFAPLQYFEVKHMGSGLFFITRKKDRKIVYDAKIKRTVFNSKNLTNGDLRSFMTDTHWVIVGVGEHKGRIVSIPLNDVFLKIDVSAGFFKRKNKFFKIKEGLTDTLKKPAAILKSSEIKPAYGKPSEFVELIPESEGSLLFPDGKKYSKKLLGKAFKLT